ncbi:iron ABC transporter permease [Nitratireductor sp. ZSWI3]|uniref:FecCD family ABC transporter permease n=1 Tax=Nitratireductor sp. ZSWI3 TaxID=2966359 RepID=UPI00214FFC0A|nr:iron ABC transporter permease [Nitratireductor sp. ZSWI3]MCR4267445.1 iron ABC transporter permease [Nitratireductor sp. ZSWI3]
MTAASVTGTPPRLSRAGRLVLLVLLLVALALLGIGLGSSRMSLDRVLLALAGEGARSDGIIVWSLRMPRLLMAVLCGGALALAGFILQRATRNVLAAPSVLGIVDGGALGVMIFLFLFSNESNALTVSILWQPLAAASGALLFAAAVVLLAVRTGAPPLRIILYGVALGALAKAGVTLFMIDGPVHRASQAATWLAGSVHEARWSDVSTLAAALAVLVPLAFLVMRRMDQLQLDEQSAAATGLPVRATQLVLFALATCLTAAAVSFAGAVGFVGLVAPHAARLVIGGRALPQAVGALLLGSAMLVAADLAVRIAFAPLEVPAGAVTAVIGAPYFLFILLRAGRVHA